MKILFIVPYSTEGPSNRYRVEQYLPYLEKRGHEYSIRPFINSEYYRILYKPGMLLNKLAKFIFRSLSRIKDIIDCSSFDILFIQREAFPYGPAFLEKLLKFRTKVFIYDFDDAVYLHNLSYTNKFLRFFKYPKKTSELLKLSDIAIAGNQYLANYAKTFCPNVRIIPSCIDINKYSIKESKPRKKTDKVILGWIGTTSSARYLKPIANILKKISKMYNIQVKLVGGFFPLDNVPVIYENWSIETEIESLKSFDIGLMPMEKEEWAKGKCGLKLIQYMGVGIPAVATAFGTNLEIVQDGVNGFLADDEAEWMDRLSQLIEDQELCIQLGKNGRKFVKENYSIQVHASNFIETIEMHAG